MKNKFIQRVIAALFFVACLTISEGASDFNQLISITDLLRSRDKEQVGQGRSRLLESEANEEYLIALLYDPAIRHEYPKAVGAAIILLGEMKATNAVDRIAGMLLYNENTGHNYQMRDWSDDKVGRKLTKEMHSILSCPAWMSLRKIGGPSLRAVAREICSAEWTAEQEQIAFILAFQALWKVEPAYEILYRTITAHRDSLRQNSTEKLDEFIMFLEKAALRTLKRVSTSHDTHYDAQFDIVGILLRHGKHDEANKILLDIKRIYPGRMDLSENRFHELVIMHNPEK